MPSGCVAFSLTSDIRLSPGNRRGGGVIPCVSIIEGHTVHSRHPSGWEVLLGVHSRPLEVNSFLVGNHLTDGAFDSTCERGHGERSREILVFLFSVPQATFLSGGVETGGWHYESYDDNRGVEYKMGKQHYNLFRGEWDT